MNSSPSPGNRVSLKAIFDAAAKSRAKNLVEKARIRQKDRECKAVKALDLLFDPNDTKDFKDSPPKFTIGKSKLKLKTKASKSKLITKENCLKSDICNNSDNSSNQDDVVLVKISNRYHDPSLVVDLVEDHDAGTSKDNHGDDNKSDASPYKVEKANKLCQICEVEVQIETTYPLLFEIKILERQRSVLQFYMTIIL